MSGRRGGSQARHGTSDCLVKRGGGRLLGARRRRAWAALPSMIALVAVGAASATVGAAEQSSLTEPSSVGGDLAATGRQANRRIGVSI